MTAIRLDDSHSESAMAEAATSGWTFCGSLGLRDGEEAQVSIEPGTYEAAAVVAAAQQLAELLSVQDALKFGMQVSKAVAQSAETKG